MPKNGEKIFHLLRRHAWKLPLRLSCNFCILRWIKRDAAATQNEAKLLNYFKEADQLPDEEQHVILKVITAYLRDFRTQQAYA